MSDFLARPRVQSAARALLLFALGLYLLTRFTSATLYFYINQRFAWLTVLAVLGLFLVAASYRPGSDQGGHDHSHGPGWAGLLLIALPILLGLTVPPRPLGVAALQNREISGGAPDGVLPAAVGAARERAPGDRTILDWVLAFREGEQPGETDVAEVVGFVYRDEGADPGRFTLARFVVGCCAADATGVGLTVAWPDSAGLNEGEWVRVTGRFAPGAAGALPVLAAESVEPVPPPSQPYLYP